MIIMNEYAHLQRHNRFYSSSFHFYYSTFISNERDKEEKIRR